MRIFTGFFLPPLVVQSLADFSAPLRRLQGVRWTRPESLHVTLQFLGEVEPRRLPEIQAALTENRGKTLRLSCREGGVFPSIKNAKIFWTGLAGDTAELARLAKILETKEDRAFRPHVTLARASTEPRPERSAGEQFCTLFKTYESPVFEVNKIQIIQSQLTGEGSRYEPIANIPLAT